MKSYPHLRFEEELWKDNFLVCGIDEVGRGSFAGPLVVGGIILHSNLSSRDKEWILKLGINDSKLLTKKKRELILKITQEYISDSYLEFISPHIINEKGVGFANKMGFENIAKKAKSENATNNIFFLTDAFSIPEVKTEKQKNIIHGDTVSISISLASIFAKVKRDSFMEDLAQEFPHYEFQKNKGYGTKLHREKLKEYGPCPHHRTDFISRHI
ncbi:MAG: ribonuclease HII [Candidatus Levybacteria bacterium]|nr:ribonuclease HII [Candidatus Levybacteria bacterium]MBP9814951.1 ribonuclease HII [Candidatus Levybacteria bacterium]